MMDGACNMEVSLVVYVTKVTQVNIRTFEPRPQYKISLRFNNPTNFEIKIIIKYGI